MDGEALGVKAGDSDFAFEVGALTSCAVAGLDDDFDFWDAMSVLGDKGNGTLSPEREGEKGDDKQDP